MHLIDYGHIRAGVLYHGTISDLDGSPKASWTYEAASGERLSEHVDIPVDVFERLWNGCSTREVFRRCMVTDANTRLDPVANHIVGLRYRDEQGDGWCTFMIPATEMGEEFSDWLADLHPPFLQESRSR